MSEKKKKKETDLKVEKVKESDSNAVAMDGNRPFPVPPGGCPDGWYDNGSGMCILDS